MQFSGFTQVSGNGKGEKACLLSRRGEIRGEAMGRERAADVVLGKREADFVPLSIGEKKVYNDWGERELRGKDSLSP